MNLWVSQNPGNFFTSVALRAFREGLGCIELASREFSTDRIRTARTSMTDSSDTTLMQISKNKESIRPIQDSTVADVPVYLLRYKTGLTFRNPASYIKDGHTATLNTPHFLYFFNKYM
jgi:hypothetical protein